MPSIPLPLPLRVPLAQQLCPKGSSEAWILALKGSGAGYVVPRDIFPVIGLLQCANYTGPGQCHLLHDE